MSSYPKKKGVSERKHRHVETGLALLYQSHLPLNFWSYAFTTAIYLINRLPFSVLGFHSPWEKLYSKTPSVHALNSFRCACYPFLRPYNKNKLQPRSTQCVFLGYPPMSKGYIFLDPTSNRIYISCHVLFNEALFPFATNPHVPFSSSLSEWLSHSVSPPAPSAPSPFVATPNSSSLSSDPDLVSSLLPSFLSSSCPILVVPTPIETHSSVSTTPILSLPVLPNSVQPSLSSSNPAATDLVPSSTNTHPMVTRSKHGIYMPRVMQVQCNYTETEPPSFTIASKHPQWVAAMDAKFQSLQKQQTWSLVPLPPHTNVVTCKWVYKLKRHSDGSIARYKARLVARGYLQQYGLDYDETFSPVVKLAIAHQTNTS